MQRHGAEEIAEIKRRYDRDGFVVLRGFASPDEVEQLLCHAEAAAGALAAGDPRGGAHRPDILKNLETESAWLASQLTGGVHLPLMRALVGDELVPATAAWFDRPSGSATEVDPHIDGGGRGDGAVGGTLWIALDAADRSNGCLHYRRGSHRMVHRKSVFQGDFDTEVEAVPVEVRPGDAVIHNALTVHWSGANPSAHPRRAVSFFYWGAASQAALAARQRGTEGSAMSLAEEDIEHVRKLMTGAPHSRSGIVQLREDGRHIVVFERTVKHPRSRVWEAIAAPGERAVWAPGIHFEPHPDAPFDIWFGDECEGTAHVSGQLGAFDPPKAIQLGSIRFDLEAVGSGCVVTFSDVLWFDGERPKVDFANAVLAGWHRFLDTLEIWLDEGRPALDLSEPDYAKVFVEGRDSLEDP